jgi:predicted secreted protein
MRKCESHRRIHLLALLVFGSSLGLAAGNGFEADMKAGTRSYGVGYSGAGQWLADINGDGRADLVYNRDNSKEYRALLADQTFPYGTGRFQTDKSAGSRNSNNNVGYSGKAQWMADLNGDGRADYAYNRENTKEYWVMLGSSNGTFATDKKAGSRNSNNNVGYSGKAQWMADVNGDGRADYVYNRENTKEYWVLLANADGTFATDKKAGSRNSDNNVGYSGKAQWMADVNGDGRADYVYNRETTKEYWVMLANADGTFATDKKAGSRNSDNNVGYDGEAQWLIDVTSDGQADYVYNRASTKEYWVMVANPDGTFQVDANWGSRNDNNNVGYGINGQGFAHLNADGREDFLYNRENTKEYWAMLSLGGSFKTDQSWGERNKNNNVGYDGKAAFLGDVNGDGLDDLVYNRDSTKEEWVMLSSRPATIQSIHLLDVWGEGYIKDGSLITGFQDSYNLNQEKQPVSNGPNAGKNIPKLVAVDNYDRPVFPIEDGGVEIMTLMGAPIVEAVANEMYRTLDKNKGVVLLYGFENGDPSLLTFERVFVTQHGFYNVTSRTTLGYPFNQVGLSPVRVYSSRNVDNTLSLGKGGRVGGAAMADSQQNEFSGGGIVHDEL